MADNWFMTASGLRIRIDEPDPALIRIEDIAHALSNICRFGGHCQPFYSVAQHSVVVSALVELPLQYTPGAMRRRQRCALLHDATEAFLGDVIRPLKQLLPEYRKLEERWEEAIARRFQLGWTDEIREAVKRADMMALAKERRELGWSDWQNAWNDDESQYKWLYGGEAPQRPEEARHHFLTRWWFLDEVSRGG